MTSWDISPRFPDLSQGYVLKPQDPASGRSVEETEEMIKFVDDNIIGKDLTFVGPFGRRKVVFCDYIASSKGMEFVEDYIKKEVLPLLSNIYASSNATTMQSSFFKEEAREILSSAVNASEDDALIFTGNGCKGAVQKLINSLNVPFPPIVFFGACEHQANLLPWIEIGSEIVRISETKEGMIDLTDLEAKLSFYQRNSASKTMIGCFSATSAITGILADDIATTILLHQYGALAFWDYGIAAPCVSLDMNPLVPGINQNGAYKDAMFFSGHKFIGGVQSSGILIAKKTLLKAVPFLRKLLSSDKLLKYEDGIKDIHQYEDNGAIGVVESVRAGIAMKIKQTIGVSAIMDREAKIVKTVCSFFRKIPEIILLGSTTLVDRLAIFSIMVRHPRGTYLHHNFVCAVLNDMFGIQARGGCTCAEPYAQDLMGIKKNLASTYETIIKEESLSSDCMNKSTKPSNYEILRPGFTRISLPYFTSESEMAYVLEALKMVATEGWKLLPQYILNPETGEWRHNSNAVSRERKRLGPIVYVNGKMSFQERKLSGLTSCPADYNDCLRIARSTFNKARKLAKRHPVSDQCSQLVDKYKNLRWFMLPTEAQDLLLGKFQNVKQEVPFSPSTFKGSKPEINIITDATKCSNLGGSTESLFRNSKLLRQRSESNSPARDEKDGLKHKQLLRERCYSLCSALVPESPTKLTAVPRKRLFSGGSQAEYTDSETSLHGDDGRAATPPCNFRNTPDLVYVEGITKELATEIKSELREVIAQVEDVLSENNDVDYNGLNYDKRGSIDYHNIYKRKAYSLPSTIMNDDCNLPSAVTQQTNVAPKQLTTPKSCCTHNSFSGTISAERFSEYLVEFTSDVVSEMKSEFRDVVNAVDGLISPIPVNEEKPNMMTNTLSGKYESANNSKETDDLSEVCMQLKNVLCSDDNENHLARKTSTPSETSSSSNELIRNNSNFSLEDMQCCGIPRKVSNAALWFLPPKYIWNPTCEAIKVFDMIKEGDRVMINLSNKKESFSLLHTLHQYQYYASSKGKNFSLGVMVEDSPENENIISFLEPLRIEYFRYERDTAEEECSSKTSRFGNNFWLTNKQLSSLAKKNNYNVLALGNHLDDVAECFFMSVFHKGCLKTMKAAFDIKNEDMRVIRPFVFVREKFLNRFVENTNFPKHHLTSFETSQDLIRIKQLLTKQEMLYPKLFVSIKTAMMPLMGESKEE